MENQAFMRIASSNIRFANPADGVNDWSERRLLWTSMVLEFAPWILGTQEGREPQLRDVATLLSSYTLIDNNREWIEERMYPCLFVNQNFVEVTNSGDVWLSRTPEVPGSKSFDSAFPRLCTWIEAKIKNTQTEIFVINTHLDHVQAATRAKQIEVLIEAIEQNNSKNAPVFLMGDFNEDPTGDVRALINQKLPNLIDPWQMLELAEETSHHKFCGTNERGARIDWILCDKTISPISIELDKRCDGKTWPSDHFMVKAQFKL